jgi:hypothetical protein
MSQISTADNNIIFILNILCIFTVYTAQILLLLSQSQTPWTVGKRYKSYLFTEGLEKEAYILHIKNME